MPAKQAASSLLYGVPSILVLLVSLTTLIDKETNRSSPNASPQG